MAWVCVLTLLLLFYLGYRHVSTSVDTAQVTRIIIAFSAVFIILTFLTVPYHSTDVFGYINRGWQQYHYAENPYIFRLADTPNWQSDPMLREHWPYNPNPYGPLFSLIAWGLCAIGNGNWWLTLALFKFVNVASFVATGWFIYDGARRLGHSPVLALFTWAWNPLVLLHHIANGHNDVVVGLFVVGAIYTLIRGWYLWTLPAAAAAVLIKFVPALIGPFLLVFLVRKAGFRRTMIGGAIGLSLALAAAMPYLKDWDRLKLEEMRDNALLLDNSLHSFLIHIYGTVAKLSPTLLGLRDQVSDAIATTLQLMFAAIFVYALYRLARSTTLRNTVFYSVLVLFVFVCVASSKFNGWYMGMILPAALLMHEGHWLRRLVVLVSAAQLGSITFLKQAYIVNYFLMHLLPVVYVSRRLGRGASITLLEDDDDDSDDGRHGEPAAATS